MKFLFNTVLNNLIELKNTNTDFKNYEGAIKYSMNTPFIKVRMRLRCELQCAGEPPRVHRVLNEGF